MSFLSWFLQGLSTYNYITLFQEMSYKLLKVGDGGGGGGGEVEDKFRAYPFRAYHIDVFPVRLDDLLHDGKPQPGAFFILAP